jgi:hypothetical protein
MKKIKESLTTDLKNEIGHQIMSIPSFDINPTEAMKDINVYNRELSEDDEETLSEPDFNKLVYNPKDKSVIGIYYVVNETDKILEVLNLLETDNESTFLDGYKSYSFEPNRIKLPKSQIEVIGNIDGKEGFKSIKIPYWLVKKSEGKLNIKRIDGNKKFSLNKSQGNKGYLEKLNDPNIDKILKITGSDKDLEILEKYRNYYKSKFNHKDETKEATSSGASGQYTQPLFGETKKVEATEATSTASSGQYSTPAFVAKNSKNWRGGKKPMFPGGKFVKIKEKCKKFPYCNQGDINALKLTETVIKKLADRYDVTENVIRTLIKNNFKQSGNNLNK